VAGANARVKIVYIEDNDANLDLVKRILHSTGRYDVLGATDGDQGIAMIEREHPQLVLVDLDIPGANGFEVIRQIKGSADPSIAAVPIAVVTANVLTHERDQALEAGCAAFIEKPFEIRAFREQIEKLVGAS
jgi:CheY-like chemotaxis protein